ncbi:hypothetical protein U1Q18_029341 [Sarracenia purpurea var. burkii]
MGFYNVSLRRCSYDADVIVVWIRDRSVAFGSASTLAIAFTGVAADIDTSGLRSSRSNSVAVVGAACHFSRRTDSFPFHGFTGARYSFTVVHRDSSRLRSSSTCTKRRFFEQNRARNRLRRLTGDLSGCLDAIGEV